MKTLALLLSVLGCAPLPANAQEADAPEGAVIESATVSGISFDRLSPGLRQDISDLDGTPLDRAKRSRCLLPVGVLHSQQLPPEGDRG